MHATPNKLVFLAAPTCVKPLRASCCLPAVAAALTANNSPSAHLTPLRSFGHRSPAGRQARPPTLPRPRPRTRTVTRRTWVPRRCTVPNPSTSEPRGSRPHPSGTTSPERPAPADGHDACGQLVDQSPDTVCKPAAVPSSNPRRTFLEPLCTRSQGLLNRRQARLQGSHGGCRSAGHSRWQGDGPAMRRPQMLPWA